MSQTRVFFPPPSNTVRVDSDSNYVPLPYTAEDGNIVPGDLVGQGSTVSQVKQCASGGGVTVPYGIADNNPDRVNFSTGASIDPSTSAYIARRTVPVITKGRMRVRGDGTVTAGGMSLMVSATAGRVAAWTTGITVGRSLAAEDTSGYLVAEIDISRSD